MPEPSSRQSTRPQYACPGISPLDERPDGEPRLRGGPGQQQSAPVRRQRERVDAVRERRQALGLATRRRRRDAPAARAGTARARRPAAKTGALSSTGAARERARSSTGRRDQPEPRPIGVPLDGSAGVGDEGAVARHGGISECDLAPDQARGRERHRCGGYFAHEPAHRRPARLVRAAVSRGG